jgi:hypothetical protein
MKKDIKEQARELRQKGYSFREISEKFSRAESTIGLWCRKEIVTEEGRGRLKKLSDDGRQKSIVTNREKRLKILGEISNNVYSKNSVKYSIYDYKLMLAMLYWGEGGKTGSCLNFTNSDPKLIAVYLKLLRLCFDIKPEKFYCCLHLHSYHDREKMIDFWSNVTGIAKSQIYIYNKENSGKQKKLDYKGCINIRYFNYLFFNEVLMIIKRFSIFLT